MDHQNEYSVQVTGLSPFVTEKDLIDFFSFSGTVEHIDIIRSGEQACTAYVMFKSSFSQEIAVSVSGATILDQRVCITRWGQHNESFDFWNWTAQGFEDESNSHPHAQRGEFNAGEAVTKAQELVKTMLATGFVLGKDALSKAKTFDESHGVSAAAMARLSQLEQRIGLTDKIFTGLEAVRMTDQRYHVSDTAKSAISATGRTAATAATSVVNSSYVSSGALWFAGALKRAAKAAADLGSRGSRQRTRSEPYSSMNTDDEKLSLIINNY